MSFKPIDSRQIKNRSALSHIGSPANDTLDDILAKIDLAIASGGGGSSGFAQEISIPFNVNTFVVTFPSPLSSNVYVVSSILTNYLDPSPQFISILVSNKTTTGFTISLPAFTDSANYSVAYITPSVQSTVGESSIPFGNTSVTIVLPFPMTGTNYVVLPSWLNTVDPAPQFQPILITNKTSTTFTASWSLGVDSVNYSLDFQVAQFA